MLILVRMRTRSCLRDDVTFPSASSEQPASAWVHVGRRARPQRDKNRGVQRSRSDGGGSHPDLEPAPLLYTHHTQRKRPNEAQQNSLSDTGSKWSGILGALISTLSLFTYNTHHGTKNEMPHIPFTFSTSENIYTAMIRHSHSRLARAMFIGWLVQQGCAVEHWMVWILWLKKIIIHKLQDLNRCDVWTLNCDSHQLHSYVQTQPKNNLKNINRIGTI